MKVFKSENLKGVLKKEELSTSSAFLNCVKLSIQLLKSEKKLVTIVNKGYSKEYAKKIVEAWRPQPTAKQKKQQIRMQRELPEAFEVVSEKLSDVVKKKSNPPKLSYKEMISHFKAWDKICKTTFDKWEGETLHDTNPYFRVSVEASFKTGKRKL